MTINLSRHTLATIKTFAFATLILVIATSMLLACPSGFTTHQILRLNTMNSAAHAVHLGTWLDFRDKREPNETVSGASRTVTSDDYGKTLFCTYAGAVAITLPAAGAPSGTFFRVMNYGAQVNADNCAITCSTPVADTLVTPNNSAADSITYGSGSRIGCCVKFVSNSDYWIAVNESAGCTMTVTDN